MPFVENAGVRIHFEVEGSGPPIVLHTGAGGDLRIWREAGYVDGLGGFTKILVDQRGRGRSDRPPTVEAHRMEYYVSDVRKVLDHLGVPAAGFLGYSAGTLVSLAFAEAYPDRLRCLVGIGSLRYRDLTDLPRVDSETAIAEDVAAGGVSHEVDVRMNAEGDRFPPEIDRNVRAGDPLMHALDGVAWLDWRGPRSVLQKISSPILILTGEKEDPYHLTEQTASLVSAVRVRRIPGVGHLGAFARSDLTLPYAAPFLREHLR